MPTALNSAEIRAQIGTDILRRSVFSARTVERGYLDLLQRTLAQVADGSVSDSNAEEALRGWLDDTGYVPDEGQAGGVSDLSSHARIRLVVNTNTEMAAGAAMVQSQDTLVLDAFPAWELIRVGWTKNPREWDARWREAGRSVGWEGAVRDRFVARKDSPIWQAIGDGAGGYSDTLGNAFPPFAYNSRMTWVAVSRADAEALGITGSPAPSDATLSPGESELVDAVASHGPDFAASLAADLEAL